MSVINKQKFLAELAKLLTFMYEEDRQRALAAYTEMFDQAEDEQLLLQSLNSPLRQAVEVARAYNSDKPGLDVVGPSKSQAFMDTINRIRTEALSSQPVRETVSEGQISLFDVTKEMLYPAQGEEAPARAAEASPAPEEAPEAQPEEAAEEPAEEPAEPEEEPAAADEGEAPEEAPPEPEPEPERVPVQKTVRKPRVLLLILYALVAIPLGLIGALLLLIPALASLAAAAICIIVAVMGISTALSSFPMISNLLIALGAALILLAVGLVFLMLFIWFLGGAIGGMINGLISLGGKWCFKEVPAK